MRQLPIEQQVLLILEIAILAALAIRMWRAGLHRVYRYFFGYLLLEFLQSLIPLVVPPDRHLYLYRDLFVISEALLVAFYAFVVLELYSKFFQDLVGIAIIARRFIRIALGLAVVIAMLPLYLEKNSATMTGYLFSFQRTVMSILLIFVLLISGFLLYYPVPLARNVISYLSGYAVYFLTISIMAFSQNMGYFWNRLEGSLNMGIFVLCLVFWLWTLSLEGEDKRMVVGHQWNRGHELIVLDRLRKINEALLHSKDIAAQERVR